MTLGGHWHVLTVKPTTLRNQCRGDDEEAEDVSGLSNQNEKWRYINISVLGNCVGQTEFRRRCKFLPQQLCPSPDRHFVNLAGALENRNSIHNNCQNFSASKTQEKLLGFPVFFTG